MIKEIPFGVATAAVGCGVLIVFFTGIFGIDPPAIFHQGKA
jgi:hypothetical protein